MSDKKATPLRTGRDPISTPNTSSYALDEEMEVDRPEDQEEFNDAPEWWNNLDATKGIGYPAREEGRYGSYPSHDGFDDESEP